MNHYKADAEIALYEQIVQELPGFIDNTDIRIAQEVEERFGIPKEDVLTQFKREDSSEFATAELIIMAHNPHFFGGK